jgi:hypothetical protein
VEEKDACCTTITRKQTNILKNDEDRVWFTGSFDGDWDVHSITDYVLRRQEHSLLSCSADVLVSVAFYPTTKKYIR